MLKPCEPEKALAVVHEALGLEIQKHATPTAAQTNGDTIPLLIDAFFEKEKQLDAVSIRLASLLEFGLDLAHLCDPDALIDKAGIAARKIIGANYSGVGILAGDGFHLRSFALFGAAPEVAAKLSQPVFDGPIFRKLLSERKAQRAFSPIGAPADVDLPVYHPPVRSFLGAPLVFGDGFTEQDEKIAVSLAAQATVSYENQQRLHKMKQYAEELRSTEEQLRQLAENIPEVFFVMTLEPPRITYISPAYDQIWGRPGQTLYEDPRAWIEAIHPEDQERVGITFAESLQGNRLDMEYRVARPDGSLRHIHARAFPVPNPEGKSSRVVGLAEDITQRKHAETARRESEEQVRLLLESTAEAIYGIDLRGDCTFCNAACVRMLGYESSAELLGKNMHATMHHSHADGKPYLVEACQIYRAFRASKGSHVDDEVLWRRDGTSFPAEYWSYPIQRDGKTIGSVVAFLDITDRKRAETELLKAKDDAEAANRTKSEFLANMSHEIRTPMNGIIGMTDLALETELNPEQAEYLHMVKGSADALLTLLNDILDFSKIEAGKLELNYLSFDLRKSLSEVVRTLAINAQRKGLEFIFDVSPEVPTKSLAIPPAFAKSL